MKEQNSQERRIRFITSDYKELFQIPDGGTIQVTFPNRQFVQKCEYIDDYHTRISGTVYHICQHAEMLERNGGRCEPESETTLDQAAWELGYRGYLLIERTKNGFRYELLTKEYWSRTQGHLDRPSWTMNQAREYVLDSVGLNRQSRYPVSYDMVKQRSAEILRAADVKQIEWMDSQYYPGMRTAEHTLSCEIRGEPYHLTYEVSQHDDGEGFVIHSDGRDIWDIMPEPELRILESVLSQAVEYGHWKRDIDQAETVEAIQEVRYGLYETENLSLTREQIGELHKSIDHKETALVTAVQVAKKEKLPVKNGLTEKEHKIAESKNLAEPGKKKVR